MAVAIISVNHLPAEEALFLGAPLAHVAQRSELIRIKRLRDQGRAIVRRRGLAS